MNLLKFKSKLRAPIRVLKIIERTLNSHTLFWIFLAYLFLTHSFNTLWFDEFHEINLINSSHTLSEFVNNMRYEGTPWLAHFVIWTLTQIYPDAYLIILLTHVFLWITIAYICLYKLGLRPLLAACILFSTPAMGYIINIRQYPWAITFLLLFVLEFTRNPKSKIHPLYLLLLGQTCTHGQILSSSIFCWIIYTNYRSKEPFVSQIYWMLASAALAIYQLLPAQNLVLGTNVHNYFPLIIDGILLFFAHILMIKYSLGLLIALLLITQGLHIYRNCTKPIKHKILDIIPPLTLFCILSFSGYIYIIITKYTTQTRHHHLFTLTFLCLLYILFHKEFLKFTKKTFVRYLVFIGFFLISCEAITGVLVKILVPRTQCEHACAYIIQTMNTDSPTMIYHDYGAPLGNRARYSLDRKSYVPHYKWDNANVDYTAFRSFVITDFTHLKKHLDAVPQDIIQTSPMLIVTAYNLRVSSNMASPFEIIGPGYRATLDRSFISPTLSSNLVDKFESFLVYRVAPTPK